MGIPVIDAAGNELFICESEIDSIIANRDEISFLLQDGTTVSPPRSLEDWLKCYSTVGFIKLDRNNVTRSQSIQKFDPKNKLVYFKSGRSVTVSEPNYKKNANTLNDKI